MRKRKLQKRIRLSAWLLAGMMGMMQPYTALATTSTEEDTVEDVTDIAEDTDDVQYISAFTQLPEDESYIFSTYKPTLEEVLEAFPQTLSVELEGEEEASEIEVVWECEDDFDNTELASYIFYPIWDEASYALADAVKDNIEVPYIVIALSNGMITNLEDAKNNLANILQDKSILASVYLCNEYDVKESAGAENQTIVSAASGQSAMITDVEMDEAGYVWYQVVLYQNGNEYTGYIESSYLATSDEDFAKWEETYVNKEMLEAVMEISDGYPDIEQFPASYQNALYALKEAHPNWIFVRMDTGIDFNTAITKELGEKSLVSASCSASWKNGNYGQGWYYASEGILRYFMDPRNFLTDPAIFQFEQLTYNGSYHTTEAVQEILNKSFMSSTIPGDNQTYAQAFTKIGKNLGISPFHLAARVLQEQGAGTSPLISGTYSGYEGYYNYFNVSAAGKTDQEVIVSGLKKAVEQGWNTRYKSLQGGSKIIGTNYILKGQDTLYLEKFNVSNGGYANFTHQYMQNIQAPSSEATNVRKAYYKAGALENSFVFKIPVYNNMPASACSKPNTTDSITLDKTSISSLEVDKTAKIIPSVNGSKVDNVSNMTFSSSNTAVATVDNQGKITAVAPGTATISCSRSGASTATCTVTVVKATPSVTTPTLSPITYKEGLKLADIVLPEGWTWVNGNSNISTGTTAYAAVYTPSDTTKYNTVTKDISFTVTKAIPDCQVPENLTIETGSKLGSIVLPSGFIWESDVETELDKEGEYTFYVSYNPDENSYYTVTHIPIIVKVTGKESAKDDEITSSGSTSNGSTSSESTQTKPSTSTGSTSTGSTSSESTQTKPSTSTGSTGNGNTSTGSTSNGSTSSESTQTKPSTSTGSTGNGSTSSESSQTKPSTSTGSTSNGSTSSESTQTKPSTSTGSTGNGNTSTGSTSNGSTSSESTQTKPSTSTGSTGNGSTSSESTQTKPSTSTGSTGNGNTSTGSTSNGSTSSESTITKPSTSTGSTGNTGNGSTSSEGTQTKPSTSTGSTGNGSTSSESTQTKPSTSTGSTSNGSTSTGSTNNGSTNGENTSSEAANQTTTVENTTTNPVNNTTNGEVNNTATDTTNSTNADMTVNVTDGAANNDTKPTSDNAITVESQTVLTAEDFHVEESAEENEQVTFAKPSVMMEMDDTTVLTAEKLQMAKEQNFNLALNMGNYATWNIDVENTDVNSLTDIDMGITVGINDIPLELIDELADGNEYLQFTLAHDGPFDFDAVLTISLNTEDSGRYANLFYYNPETKELEFICTSVIGADGQASFQMAHASSYVIVVSDQTMEGLLTSDGENGIIKWIVLGVFIFMLFVVAGYGIFFFWKNKQEEEEEKEEDADDIVQEEEDGADVEEAAEQELESEQKEQPIQKEKKEKSKKSEPNAKQADSSPELEKVDMNASAEEDWIEDEDWKEPEADTQSELEEESEEEPSLDSENAEDDWIDDDEWDVGNDWMDDDEWERKKDADKAKEEENRKG